MFMWDWENWHTHINFDTFNISFGSTCWASAPSITFIKIYEGSQALQMYIFLELYGNHGQPHAIRRDRNLPKDIDEWNIT